MSEKNNSHWNSPNNTGGSNTGSPFAPASTNNTGENPNNPFRNANAVGAVPPPSYENAVSTNPTGAGGPGGPGGPGPGNWNNGGGNWNNGGGNWNNNGNWGGGPGYGPPQGSQGYPNQGTFAPPSGPPSQGGGWGNNNNWNGPGGYNNGPGPGYGGGGGGWNGGGNYNNGPPGGWNGGYNNQSLDRGPPPQNDSKSGGNWDNGYNNQQGSMPLDRGPPAQGDAKSGYNNYNNDGPNNNYSQSRDFGGGNNNWGNNGPYQSPQNSGPGNWNGGGNQQWLGAPDQGKELTRSRSMSNLDPNHFDPNQASANRSGGSGGGILASLGGKNPLDPPPPQFSRQAPSNYPYLMFQPIYVVSNSHKLDDGFPPLPPPAGPGDQHPFMSHDIQEEDWMKFLHDIKTAGSLSGKDRLISNGIPMAMGMSFVGGLMASHVIEGRMKEKKIGPAGDLIDAWNNYFFNPRRINIVLCQDDLRYSGRIDDRPPDMMGGNHKRSKSSNDYYDDDRDDRGRYQSNNGFLAATRIGSLASRSSSQGRNMPMTRIEARWNRKQDRRDMLFGAVGSLVAGGSSSNKSSRSNSYSGGGGGGGGGNYGGARGVDRHGKSLDKWRLVLCYWDGRREIL